MAAGTNRKISAASARAHTRKPKSKTSSGILKKILLIGFVGLVAWAYQSTRPPPPKTCGSVNGPPVTASRIQLKDGRHLAYEEYGVPKNIAKNKIVFVHGFDSCRLDVSVLTAYLSPEIVESKSIYIASFDRPGYGESDPHPARTVKSIALDIEELADKLGLGSKFYIVGYSMGGQIVWSCLKYIPHRLAGAAMIAPAINYWWPSLPSNISQQAYKQLSPQDQWVYRVAHYLPWLTYWWNTQSVAHYLPWLTYWWNTQKLFPASSVIARSPTILSKADMELMPRIFPLRKGYKAVIRQQGEFESLHRDAMIGLATWEFDPTDLKNPFAEGEEGSVHLWQGDEDVLVPVALQRYIASQLPWIKYHELSGAGHMLAYADGMADSIIQALVPSN